MSLSTDNLRFVLLKAIADAAAKELGDLRDAHLEPLLERYDDEGTSSYKVKLPDGTVVANLALSVPKGAVTVTDDAAFTAWVRANHPDAVEEVFIPGEPEQIITVPATEDRTDYVLKDKKVSALMKQFKATEEGVVDTATGQMVAGAEYKKGAKPKAFAVTYETDGREQLAGAYRAGKLDEIVAGTSLPAVGQRPVLERRLEVVRLESATVDGRPAFTVEQETPIVRGPSAWVADEGTSYNEDEPVAPPIDQEPITPTSLEEAFGEQDVAPRYGYEVVGCPYDDCTGCVLCDPDGDYSRFEGDGDEEWRQAGMDAANLEPRDLRGEEIVLDAQEEAAAGDDCDQDEGAEDDFDPGDWGAASTGKASGW